MQNGEYRDEDLEDTSELEPGTPDDALDKDDDPITGVDQLSENPDLDDALRLRLTYDLATGIHPAVILARRYGMKDISTLKGYLRSYPQVTFEARRLRSIFRSDSNAEERVRLKFVQAVEQVIMPLTGIAVGAKVPLATRIDAIKQIQRGAGFDGGWGAGKSRQGNLSEGQAFQLTINFANQPPMQIIGEDIHGSADKSAALPEITTVVEADELDDVGDEV